MSIRNNISLNSMLVTLPITLQRALEVINANTLGIVFVVDNDRKLLGVLTDGDARRNILSGATLEDLITERSSLFNRSPHSLPIECQIPDIWELFEKEVRCIPLVDSRQRVVDFSTRNRIRQFVVSQPDIGEQEVSNVLECVTSGWISSQGRFIGAFESAFSEYLGGGSSIAVSNGTVALQLALTALGVGVGDEVIVPNFTFGASVNAIIHAGATPVLVDVDPTTWTLDLEEVSSRINSRTKAIMPVHIYGQPAHIDEILSLAAASGLLVIEDCAEALGATYKARRVGRDGHATCFSFFANKCITTGEGGMVVFRDPVVAQRARVLRDHGMNPQKKYWHDHAGFNFRMTNMQAGIGLAQMERIDELIGRRRQLFRWYDEIFCNQSGISLLPKNEWSENSCWLYTVVLTGYNPAIRDRLITQLSYRGIDVRPGFYPMHQMNPYREFSKGDYPVSCHLSEKAISLPTSISLARNDIIHIGTVFLDELKQIERDEINAE